MERKKVFNVHSRSIVLPTTYLFCLFKHRDFDTFELAHIYHTSWSDKKEKELFSKG